MITEYQFGEFLVVPSQNQISAQGDVRELEPRTMDVLVYLIKHSDRIVSADELLEKLWPGRIVEGSTIHRRISQLRSTLDDSAKQSKYIKTVVKRGYQAVADVSIVRSEKKLLPGAVAIVPLFRSRLLIPGAFVLSVVAGFAFFLSQNNSEILNAELNSTPSIAVLPFTNMSEFSENGFFADGIHEDLLTNLSAIPGLGVISRTSVLRYADHEQSLIEIGKELNVNYVVEGSVRRQNQQVRIAVQLIDAHNDQHVWAMTYDRDLADTFQIQSEITREVAEQLSLQIIDKEVASYDTELNDVLFKARELMRERTSESLTMALKSLRTTRAKYPNSAEVHSAIGETLYLLSRENKSWQDVSEEAMQSFELALELEPDSVTARLALARVQVWWLRDIPAADLNYQAVIEAAPNNADALMKYGEFLANTRSMRDVAMPHLRRAVVLNPYSGETWSHLASNLMRGGDFEESYEVLMQGFARVPDDYYLLRYRMEYFLFSGDQVEAMKLLLELIRRDPEALEQISLLANNLRRLDLLTDAQLWVDEIFRINPDHTSTYTNEVNQLRYLNDWQGLSEVNAKWEPVLGGYVKAPVRNWSLFSMQAKADKLWREDKTEAAQQVYGDIATALMKMNIPDRMAIKVLTLGPERLEMGNLLAHALLRTDQRDEAEDLLTKISRNEGTGGNFAINKAFAQAMLGNTDSAIAEFKNAVTASVPDVRRIRQFMHEHTDWLNDINRSNEATDLYQTYLTKRDLLKARVQAEIPQAFHPATFLKSARQQL